MTTGPHSMVIGDDLGRVLVFDTEYGRLVRSLRARP